MTPVAYAIITIKRITFIEYILLLKGLIMNKYLKLVPLCLFLSYGIKLLHSGAQLSDAPIFAVLASLAAFYEFKDSDKSIKKLEKDFEDLKKNIETKDKDIKDLRDHVGSLKLGQMKLTQRG